MCQMCGYVPGACQEAPARERPTERASEREGGRESARERERERARARARESARAGERERYSERKRESALCLAVTLLCHLHDWLYIQEIKVSCGAVGSTHDIETSRADGRRTEACVLHVAWASTLLPPPPPPPDTQCHYPPKSTDGEIVQAEASFSLCSPNGVEWMRCKPRLHRCAQGDTQSVDTCTLSHLAGVMKTTVVVRQTAVSAWHSTVHSPWPALGGFTTCHRLLSTPALLASYPPVDRFPSPPSPRCAGGARQCSCSAQALLTGCSCSPHRVILPS